MNGHARIYTVLSRNSALALLQVEEALRLVKDRDAKWTVTGIDVHGDKNKDIPLTDTAETDFFTREIDRMLLDGMGDMAVHSAKDLPYPLPHGLKIAALLPAFDRTDTLVSRDNVPFEKLQTGARIGTSSAQRKSNVLSLRPDLEVYSVRGTIEERIRFVETGELDAVIVATCALKRLGFEKKIAQILPFETHPLQGHLAIVIPADRDDLIDIWKAHDIRQSYGAVYLVGAGPGDPKLLTLRAHEALKEADTILYDNLVSQAILSKYKARKIYVGKEKDKHTPQEKINNLVYTSALEGKTTVRLKGGDPFIFGRGGEETDYLRQRLITPIIVPGITSALGAAAYTGIPLTYRGLSSSVAFCTGHPKKSIRFPDVETRIYYMCAENLSYIAETLMQRGTDADTPVACIRNATLPDQKTTQTTLRELAAGHISFAAPIIAIIGKTTTLSQDNGWFSSKKKILFLGTNPKPFAHLGEIVHEPVVRIQPLPDYTKADKELVQVSAYDWLIFPSRHAAAYFFKRLRMLGMDSRSLAGCKIASLGTRTTRSLENHGITPDHEAEKEISDGLIKYFRSSVDSGQSICIPCSSRALPRLAQGLTQLGNAVRRVPIYDNVINDTIQRTDISCFDTAVFTSPSCVEYFKRIYGAIPENLKCIPIGETTRKALVHAKAQTIQNR